MQNISVIIPAYNEAENIGLVFEGLKNYIQAGSEVIIVDDSSTDDTAGISLKYGVKVIKHPYRMGNGACIISGIREANGDILVFMDADGQHNPMDIDILLKYMPEFDMVVGARDKASFPIFHRKLANKFYNMFASYVTRFKVEDLTSGFRAVKKGIAKKFLYLLPNNFSYPTTLTLAALRTGRPVKYISIKAVNRKKGKSKINIISDGVRFLLIILKIAVLFSPLRVFLPVSFLFLAIGLGYYGYTYINFHRFTNMAALLIMNSVIIFMLGLVAEEISDLRFDRSEG